MALAEKIQIKMISPVKYATHRNSPKQKNQSGSTHGKAKHFVYNRSIMSISHKIESIKEKLKVVCHTILYTICWYYWHYLVYKSNYAGLNYCSAISIFDSFLLPKLTAYNIPFLFLKNLCYFDTPYYLIDSLSPILLSIPRQTKPLTMGATPA